MACAPIDLEDFALQFEKEEELLFKATEKFQIYMRVEDSGSLLGLTNTLIENDGFDVIHISGHAGIDNELGPVFIWKMKLEIWKKPLRICCGRQ